MASVKTKIKNATKATTTKVSTDYTPGEYAEQNRKVEAAADKNISNAKAQAETAYKLAAANIKARATQSNRQNNTVTRQVAQRQRRAGVSLTNRNVAGAASARSAGTINTARTNADRNATLTRDTAVNRAKQSAYEMAAQNKASNSKADIARSAQQNKMKAQQTYQSAEAQKSRDLSNAITEREDALDQKKRKYEKGQRQLKAYTDTLAVRYQSVKAVDKAIKKMKKNKNAAYQKTKLAYLQALRAQLKQKGSSGSGGGGGRRGGWGRSYGAYRKSTSTKQDGSDYSLDDDSKKKKTSGKGSNLNPKNAGSKNVTDMWYGKGRTIKQPSAKKQDKKAAKNKANTSVRWRGNTARKNGKKK